MAEVVLTLGVPHTPLLWSLMTPPVPADLTGVMAEYTRFRRMLEEARPDTIVLVASDHFRQLMTANMPAFLIGKAARMRGTHPNEEREFGMPSVSVPGDEELARALLGHHELPKGFDFSFSDEPWLDHAFVIPLLYLTPALDVPIVPVFTNCNAPPLPGARRFADLGGYLRSTITAAAIDRRVAVLASGHLAFELGGPRQFLGESPDQEFDEQAVAWMAAGDVEGAVAGTGFDRLNGAGNLTFQVLNFITALAAAGGQPATHASAIPCRFGNEPFFAWSEAS
jgi:aromatic ring-opening dioxygenase catalytic subunit (LigB family)